MTARDDSRPLAAFLALAAAVKLLVILAAGPGVSPDTGGYLEFADAILKGWDAVTAVPWGADAGLPSLVFRTAGYPLLLAGAKLLAGAHYQYVVVAAQSALTLLSMLMIFRLSRALLASDAAAWFVGVFYLFSQSLLYDVEILSDSLYATLFNVVLFGTLGGLTGAWRLGGGRMILFGLLWGWSILVRENGLYFTVLPVLLLACGGRRAALMIPVFLAAVAAVLAPYLLWNWHRTGEAFISVAGAANWLRPGFHMLRFGYANPFDGDDPVSQLVRQGMPDYEFGAQVTILEALQRQLGLTPTRLQSYLFERFVATVSEYPVAYLKMVLTQLRPFSLGSVLTDPAFALNEFFQYGPVLGQRVLPGVSLKGAVAVFRDFSLGGIAGFLLAAAGVAVSTVLFFVFAVGVPWWAVRVLRGRAPAGPRFGAALFGWTTFFTVVGAFCLVHFEMRHALPAIPLALLGMAAVIREGRAKPRIA